MCIHHWSLRKNSNNSHTEATCADCPAVVDVTAAREEYDRQRAATLGAYRNQYDPWAGWVETPGGRARFVAYDGLKQEVTVEADYRDLVVYPATDVFLLGG